MSTRVELEAARARADADWRRTNDDLDKAQAKLAKANAGWDKVVVDRRKPDTAWDRKFPDRRKAGSDRRIPAADIAALSQAVTERHGAYVYRSKAEADCAAAEARLDAASAARDEVIAALDALTSPQRKA